MIELIDKDYIIVKLNKVVTEKVEDKESIDTYYNDYISMIQEEIDFAFMSDLRAKADIDVSPNFFGKSN